MKNFTINIQVIDMVRFAGSVPPLQMAPALGVVSLERL